MPFGLKNAPFFFPKIMSNLLGDLDFVKIFLDGLLIFSKNYKQHIIHLEKVLDILCKHNIIINIEKSNFIQNEVTYLGQIINKEGTKPDTSRVNTLSLREPKTRKE
ncbi:Retrovirus-related Pol polyprotein from transposon opus [Dictyocoela muelleri]|nr:Retrovirus-related Pol polyprotein from transposon opus [Dictyocoela muelleri]